MSTPPLTGFDDPPALAREAAEHITDELGAHRISLAMVLGSGWSAAAALGETIGELDLDSVPGFSRPTVAGHGASLRLARLHNGHVILVLTGRTHFYERRGVAPVVHGVRTAAALGAGIMLLTNGCGGLNPAWPAGTPVLIRDHINLTGASPLVGATFVDMTDAYDPRLIAAARSVAPELDDGVYVQFSGPQYETPAEVRMAGVLGGDLVGMSTTLETIAAREAGMRVLGLSLVTNPAAGVADGPLDHSEVLAAGSAAGDRLAELLNSVLPALTDVPA